MALKQAFAVLVPLLIDSDDDDPYDDSQAIVTGLMASSVISVMPGEEKSRIQGYIEEVVPRYTQDNFRRMFRMNPPTYATLLNHIKDFEELQPAGPGRRDPIPIEKQLFITLWYLGGVDTIIKIADRFGLSESSVVLIRDKILSAINKLCTKMIRWPDEQTLARKETEFGQRNNFPGIVGALDGTHIQIKAPRSHPQSYVNRKGFHSIQLQCVCGHDMTFTDVFTGYPGSCHDSRLLRNSDLWTSGMSKCDPDYHILADGAYPLRTWLLTPYRDNGHLTPQQKKFNHYHSSNRIVIERAFALLKNLFRRLHYIDTVKVSTAVEIIMACCILHNVCIFQNDEIEEFLSNPDDDTTDNNENPIPDQNQGGATKRDSIERNLV